MKSYLNPDTQQSQFQRARSFVDGLTQALDHFNEKFKITARGMSRSYWADNPEDLANVRSGTLSVLSFVVWHSG